MPSCRAVFTFILLPLPPHTAAGQTAAFWALETPPPPSQLQVRLLAAALTPAGWALETPPQKLCFAKNTFLCPFVVHFYVFPALFDIGMFSVRPKRGFFEGVQGRDI